MIGIKQCIEAEFSKKRNSNVVHRVIFVRHGETESNTKIMEGEYKSINLNSPLTEKGHRQASEVATFLNSHNYRPDQIFVSPLDRAIDTATKFSNNFIIESALLEFNYKTNSKINIGTTNLDYPKETEEEFNERCDNFLEQIKNIGSLESRVDTLIYGHSLVIAKILGIKHMFHLSNCSLTILDVVIDEKGQRKTEVLNVNYTAHLTEPSGHHSSVI